MPRNNVWGLRAGINRNKKTSPPTTICRVFRKSGLEFGGFPEVIFGVPSIGTIISLLGVFVQHARVLGARVLLRGEFRPTCKREAWQLMPPTWCRTEGWGWFSAYCWSPFFDLDRTNSCDSPSWPPPLPPPLPPPSHRGVT